MEAIIVVLVILAIPLFLGALIFFTTFGESSIVLYESGELENDKNILLTQAAAEWAAGNGFDFVGFYTAKVAGSSAFTAAWKSRQKPTYLCQYNIHDGKKYVVTFDIATSFKDGIDLTTCSKKDAHLFPKPPGIYVQSFTASGFDELYERHLDAETYLVEEGRALLSDVHMNFEEYFVDSLDEAACNNRKHWYRFPLVLYYYFVRLNRFHDKSIREQHELGMIRLPDMLFDRFEQ